MSQVQSSGGGGAKKKTPTKKTKVGKGASRPATTGNVKKDVAKVVRSVQRAVTPPNVSRTIAKSKTTVAKGKAISNKIAGKPNTVKKKQKPADSSDWNKGAGWVDTQTPKVKPKIINRKKK
jgi:hypothetical protein